VRVLVVAGLYPPNHVGGYETACASFVGHLRDQGHEVRVLAAHHPVPPGLAEEPGVFRELDWYRDRKLNFRGVSPAARLGLERRNHGVMANHLDTFRPEVINWWAMGGMSLSLLAVPERRGIPAIGMVSDEWMVYAPKVDGWTRAFRTRPRLGRAVSAVTGVPTALDYSSGARWSFVSRFLLDKVRAQGIELGETLIGHTGINLPELAPTRAADGFAGRLLYVGRVAAVKGVDVAVGALAELPRESTLTIVGAADEDFASRLEEITRESGLSERVRLDPPAERRALSALYGSADALLFPVRWDEPWGLVPLEAMACGVPVIATGTGGSAEYLVDESNCLLVPRDDATALARAVRRLADDPALRARLRQQGLVTARRFPEQRCNAIFEQQLLETVAAGGAG
jgi:glycogen(starch) synthase